MSPTLLTLKLYNAVATVLNTAFVFMLCTLDKQRYHNDAPLSCHFLCQQKATPLSLYLIAHSLQLPTQRQSNSSATIPALNRLCERMSGIFKSVQGRERNVAFKEGSSLVAWWSCSQWAFDVCVLRLNLTWPCNIKHCFIKEKEMDALPVNEYRAHCFKFNIASYFTAIDLPLILWLYFQSSIS